MTNLRRAEQSLFRLGLLCAVVTACAGSASARDPEARETRLAVIPGAGERAPSEAVVAFLEAALSREAGVGLVERSSVRDILAEHKLAASGLAAPGTAARLGRLLSADALVFVEKLAGAGPPACRVQIVETETGATLGQLLGAERRLCAEASPAVAQVRSALAKLGVPRETRRYLGVLGFRSGEPGRSLDGFAEALGMLVTTDLGASPSVVLLDREHLRHLTGERDLTGVELRLRTSALLLDGGLERVPLAEEGEGKLDITVRIRPLAGGETQRVTVRVPAGNVPAARRALTAALLEKLRAEAQKCENTDPKKEAAVFRERADVLVAHGETEAGARAAEAALALDANQETRRAAAEAWHRLAFELFKAAREGFDPGGGPRTAASVGARLRAWLEKVPTDRKVRILAAQLREAALEDELRRHHARLVERGEAKKPYLPTVATRQGRIRIPALPGERQVRLISDQIERLDREMLRFALDYYAGRWEETQHLWWRALGASAVYDLHHWADDAEEWSALLRETVTLSRSPPGKADTGPRNSFYQGLVGAFYATRPQWFTGPEDRRVVLDTLDWIAGQEGPLLRMTGHVARAAFANFRDAAPARAAFEVFGRELPFGHPDRDVDSFYRVTTYLFGRAMQAINDPAERARHCGDAVEPIIAARDRRGLIAWQTVIRKWLSALERCGRYRAADDAAERILAILGPYKDGDGANSLRGALEKKRAGYAEKLSRPLPRSAAWDGYEMDRVDVGAGPRDDACLLTACLQERRLVLVWMKRVGEGTVRLLVTSVPVGGGRQTTLGEAMVAHDRRKTSGKAVTCVAADGEAVYVGTEHGGLVVLRGGKAKVWTEENGLPANTVCSAACYGGKVYLGVGGGSTFIASSGSLVEFDPPSARFRILASSRSQEEGNPLNGGKPYSISAIVPDAKRRCLWLGVRSMRWPFGRNGLWKYRPDTGRAERVWKTRHCFGIGAMTRQRGKILASGGSGDSVVMIDPVTLDKVWLAGDRAFFPAQDCRNAPRFGDPVVGAWPCALVPCSPLSTGPWTGPRGDALLTGGRGLRLHTGAEGPPAALSETPDGRRRFSVKFLYEVDEGILVGTGDRDVWMIRRRVKKKGSDG